MNGDSRPTPIMGCRWIRRGFESPFATTASVQCCNLFVFESLRLRARVNGGAAALGSNRGGLSAVPGSNPSHASICLILKNLL